MSAVVRWSVRSLTAVFLSAAVAWGSPVAAPPARAGAPAPAPVVAVAAPAPSLVLSPAEGEAGTPVLVDGSGFAGCFGKRPGTVSLYWDDEVPVGSAQMAQGEEGFTAEFAVPADASAGEHLVRAVCDRNDAYVATAAFTVVDGELPPPVGEPVVTVTPDQGRAGIAQPVLTGAGFDCPSVELLWDGGLLGSSEVSEEGTFEATLQISDTETAGDHALLVRCAGDPGRAAEASFTVTAPDPSVEPSPEPSATDTDPVPTPDPPTPAPPTPDPPTPVPPDPNANSGSGPASVGWVVGSSLLGAGLLAAAGAAYLAHRQRGPRWVHEHVGTRLRPSPGSTGVSGPPGHSVRLEPRADPGEQTVQEEDR
ncbi:hypothetical protein ACFWP3_41780 [Streptomyces sp. NPDC058525]|uniref:hypothetical protein n=1 Tax=Streptomyces sp. NPDC058525 TaxID=3346538 RepID=UPI0036644AC9